MIRARAKDFSGPDTMPTVTDARALFTGIAPRYELPASLLSFGQYRRWRRFFAAQTGTAPGDLILDIATGTGLTARALRTATRARVVGVDLTPAMLARAGDGDLAYAAADARALPFPDERFDAVTFSYLLRYVDDVDATLREATRVLKRGGMLVSMEFGMPQRAWARLLWRVYTSVVMPAIARIFGRAWREVGTFLGPNIAAWARAWPAQRQAQAWGNAGVDVLRIRRLSFGACVVMAGRKR